MKRAGACLATVLAGLAFATPASASEPGSCANAQLRLEDGSLFLPDCRAYELVSPVDKNGGAIQGFGGNAGGDVLQAAAAGDAATYSSSASFAGGFGAPVASQYLSRRTGAGWLTENITGPTSSGAYGNGSTGVPYQLFAEDLGRGLLLEGRRCAKGEPCPRSYALRDSDTGALTPIAGAAGMHLRGASPNLQRLIFEGEAGFYEWSGGGLVPVSPPPPSPGVLGTSADGQAVYRQTEAGLFLSRDGETIEIAPGPEAAQPSDYMPGSGTSRVSPDGTHLAFLSEQPLTGYDNTDMLAGEPDSELFLYSAPSGSGQGTLLCVSCNPEGEAPEGPSSIPGAIANGTAPGSTRIYKPRNLSAAGDRLFFDSADRLVAGDASAAQDVYEWESSGTGSCSPGSSGFFPAAGGCIFLVSSGRSPDPSSFVDASSGGRDAFFLTVDSLLERDPGSFDLYDARELGGFPEPQAPIPCEGDACQPLPSPPENPSPGTLVPGFANPPVRFRPPPCPRGKHRVTRHGKRRCVPMRRHHRHRRRG